MSTDIRAKISTKNRYWISKHRYYELRHFCLQYPDWKKSYASIDGLHSRSSSPGKIEKNGSDSDPTSMFAEARIYFYDRIHMVEKAAEEAADSLSFLLLRAVTEEISYEHLDALVGIPCCKDS